MKSLRQRPRAYRSHSGLPLYTSARRGGRGVRRHMQTLVGRESRPGGARCGEIDEAPLPSIHMLTVYLRVYVVEGEEHFGGPDLFLTDRAPQIYQVRNNCPIAPAVCRGTPCWTTQAHGCFQSHRPHVKKGNPEPDDFRCTG